MNKMMLSGYCCLFAVAISLMPTLGHADKLCLKVSPKNSSTTKIQKKQVASDKSCPRGYTALIDTSTLTGPTGAQGAEGENGKMKIYGDGSAGASVISSSKTLSDSNLQYTDFTVNAATTLTVPSGTVIRCTGTFTNNGIINVSTGSEGAYRQIDSTAIDSTRADPMSGIGTRAAGSGEVGDNSAIRSGGSGGIGLTEFEARQIRYPGVNAGGGGGAAGAGTGHGLDGGGSLVILCKTAVVNNGDINANGQSASLSSDGGGGGGGVIILASPGSVTNSGSGVISAAGGDGGESDTDQGSSGGGGGGLIHFISPTFVNEGSATALKGSEGALGGAGSVSSGTRSGGGGGGASAGDGGLGGYVATNNSPGFGSAGGNGYVLSTAADPTGLF